MAGDEDAFAGIFEGVDGDVDVAGAGVGEGEILRPDAEHGVRMKQRAVGIEADEAALGRRLTVLAENWVGFGSFDAGLINNPGVQVSTVTCSKTCWVT